MDKDKQLNRREIVEVVTAVGIGLVLSMIVIYGLLEIGGTLGVGLLCVAGCLFIYKLIVGSIMDEYDKIKAKEDKNVRLVKKDE